jgi:plastocyanin
VEISSGGSEASYNCQMRTSALAIRPLAAILASTALLLVACGDDETPDEGATEADTAVDATGPADAGGDAATDGASITLADFTYDPTELTTDPGAEVTLVNEDATTHTATSTDGGFDSGDIPGGEDGTFTAPEEPGEYSFFCDFHPSMKGTLVVG